MKVLIKKSTTVLNKYIRVSLLTVGIIIFFSNQIVAQDTVEEKKEEKEGKQRREKVEQTWTKRTFGSNLIIDDQTVMVPIKGTLEWDIQHRFGTFTNGYDDFWGFFASSNIRLGFTYVPIENLQIGFGTTKYKHYWDFNAKYAIMKQSDNNKFPVSITYYGNITLDGRRKDDIGELYHKSDRLSFFNQIIIARKFHDYFSLQIAPSLSHFNLTQATMKNDHFALEVGARVKLSNTMNLLINYDQPLTKHTTNNPDPNVSVALEVSTSSHAFQLIFGNYYNLNPQDDNYYNTNYWLGGDGEKWKDNWRIGFNITRLWNW